MKEAFKGVMVFQFLCKEERLITVLPPFLPRPFLAGEAGLGGSGEEVERLDEEALREDGAEDEEDEDNPDQAEERGGKEAEESDPRGGFSNSSSRSTKEALRARA